MCEPTKIQKDLEAYSHYYSGALNALRNLCYGLSKNAGWHDNPVENGTAIALIHSELSEAMTGDRTGAMDEHLPHRKMMEVEMADAVMRIFDFCGKNGLDIGGALVEKAKYNQTRADHKKENRDKEGGKKY